MSVGGPGPPPVRTGIERRAVMLGLIGAVAPGQPARAEPQPLGGKGRFRCLADYTFGRDSPAATIRDMAGLRQAFFFHYIYDQGRLDRLPYEWARHTVYEPDDPRSVHVFTSDALILKGRVPAGGGLWPGGLEAGMLRAKRAVVPGTYLELKAKLPHGIGLLPAFWLIAGAEDDSGRFTDTPWPPEIDIFEFLQFRTRSRPTVMEGHVQVNNHPERFGNPHDLFSKFDSDHYVPGIDFSASYHTFALDWIKDRPIWIIDGVPIKQTYYCWGTLPAHVLVGNQIGLTMPGVDVSGMSQDDSDWDFAIQYLRIWERVS